MWRRLGFLVRREERRAVAVSCAFMFAMVASHTALESARDGLFMARVPGSRLPLVYIAIAVMSFLATRIRSRVPLSSRRLELAAWTAFAGIGTFAIGLLLGPLGDAGLYVLYIWTGVITAAILIHFWTIVGEVFTATQAKRVYGIIGLGSMVGAIAGSGAASVMASFASPRVIVFAAGLGFMSTAWLPRELPERAESASAGPSAAPGLDPLVERFRANVDYATRGPYVWRLLGVVLTGSVAVTLTDFAFKSTFAARIPTAELTGAFARTYLLVNILALGVQLLAISVFMRRFSPSTMVAVLPVLLVLGGAGLAVTGSVVFAVASKGADGALRHGLYKTGVELFCVPLSQAGRRKVKAALEVAGQRGGQVVASTFLLVLSAIVTRDESASRVSAWLVAGLAVIWAGLAIRLHGYYVEQFRESIEDPARRHSGVPEKLDVASLETLVAALDSDAVEDVLASLRLLERERKDHVVPALILFHPREEVVVAALRLFARRGRRLPAHAFDHLLAHASPKVRAEACAAKVAIDPRGMEALRHGATPEAAPEVRAAVVAAMAANGTIAMGEARAELMGILEGAGPIAKVVVAETIGWRAIVALDDIAVHLARDPDRQVQFAAIHALASVRTRAAADALVELLADEPAEQRARIALAKCGAVGFAALVSALEAAETVPPVRWAIPRALASVDPIAAAPALLDHLERETDGMVRYRTMVALTTIVQRTPTIRLDTQKIQHEIREQVGRAYRYIDRRLALGEGTAEDPSRSTEGQKLLIDLLHDKERSAVGRIFRLLALAFPQHDFTAIYRAIENGERPRRAGAVELTSNLLPSPLREAVVGLVEDIDDEARLRSASPFHERVPRDYEELLATLLESRSAIVRDVAAFHVAELGSAVLAAKLEAVQSDGAPSGDVERALEILSGARSRRASVLNAMTGAERVG